MEILKKLGYLDDIAFIEKMISEKNIVDLDIKLIGNKFNRLCDYLRILGINYTKNPLSYKKEIIRVYQILLSLIESIPIEIRLKDKILIRRFQMFVRAFKKENDIESRISKNNVKVLFVIVGQTRGYKRSSSIIKKFLSENKFDSVYFSWDKIGLRLPSSDNPSMKHFERSLDKSAIELFREMNASIDDISKMVESICNNFSVKIEEKIILKKFGVDNVFTFDEVEFEKKYQSKLDMLLKFSSRKATVSKPINMLKMAFLNKQVSSFIMSKYSAVDQPDVIIKVRPDVLLNVNELNWQNLINMAMNNITVIDSNKILPFSGDQFVIASYENFIKYASLWDVWDYPYLRKNNALFNINAPHAKMSDFLAHLKLNILPIVKYKRGFDTSISLTRKDIEENEFNFNYFDYEKNQLGKKV